MTTAAKAVGWNEMPIGFKLAFKIYLYFRISIEENIINSKIKTLCGPNKHCIRQAPVSPWGDWGSELPVHSDAAYCQLFWPLLH